MDLSSFEEPWDDEDEEEEFEEAKEEFQDDDDAAVKEDGEKDAQVAMCFSLSYLTIDFEGRRGKRLMLRMSLMFSDFEFEAQLYSYFCES